MDASNEYGLGTKQKAHKTEIYRSDYQAPDFIISHVDMNFDIDGEDVVVTTTSKFKKNTETVKDLILDGGPYMELRSIFIDGKELSATDYQKSDHTLVIFDVDKVFTLQIKTSLKPKQNTRLNGLYWSGGNFCTQCEAEGFRHITYFLDRPDVMSTYTVRIEADKASVPVLLSNGNRKEEGELSDGRHFAIWHDPHPKPSYLFALVAGALGCVTDKFETQSGQSVELNIYVRPEDLGKCDYAMRSLKRSMKWDEDVYGLEYDLDIYNIVAVSDFNMGAMENKGLNVFNTKYVLADDKSATDADIDHVEGVIGHEYFHNWTGNRVTCRDWFQLSLKEGLTVFRDQEFSSDMTSRAVKRLDDVRVLRTHQFAEDSSPLAHPVRPDKYIEINNFYTATVYNKGAEVIRMMHTIIGESAFRRGMDLYFERHDGQAVTCEDFVCAMEDASGVDLKQFRLWYSQAGTPKVEFQRERKGADLILTVEQTCPATPGQSSKRPYHMPILMGWIGPDGNTLTPKVSGNGEFVSGRYLMHLTKQREQFIFKGVPKGAVPSLMRNFSAPVKVTSDLAENELVHLLKYDVDPYARWEAGQVLARKAILSACEKPSKLSPNYINAIESLIVDDKMDPALTAELLQVPSEVELGQSMSVLMPEELHRAREQYITQIAKKFSTQILDRYKSLTVEAVQGMEQHNKAARRLRNVYLSYLYRIPGQKKLVLDHFQAAKTMTDKICALSMIASSNYSEKKACLSSFYSEWQDNDLVIDKWFAVQAQSSAKDTIDNVKALIEHKAFNIRNPNRLRALVSTFASLNVLHFNNVSGAGYNFLADMIIKVDAINPQTSARMVSPLSRWKQLDNNRQIIVKSVLERVKESKDISDDVKELVVKLL